MTDFKTGSVQANGLNFHYLEMGEGPLALCLHGFPDHAYSFRHLLPDLAGAGFRAVAPFMRGYAPTEAPEDGNYRAVLLARDAVALVDALGGGQAYLIGNDWGAGAVIGASVLAPEKVNKLVIIASGRVDEELAMDYWYLRGTWHFYFFQMPFAERAVAHNDYAYVEQWWRDASPEWEIPASALESIRETFRKPGVVEAALGYYRARFGPAPQDPDGPARTSNSSTLARSLSPPWPCTAPATVPSGWSPSKASTWMLTSPVGWRRPSFPAPATSCTRNGPRRSIHTSCDSSLARPVHATRKLW